jgi:hypothetical protein
MLSVPGKERKALLLLSCKPAASSKHSNYGQALVKPRSITVKYRQLLYAVSAREEKEGAAAA